MKKRNGWFLKIITVVLTLFFLFPVISVLFPGKFSYSIYRWAMDCVIASHETRLCQTQSCAAKRIFEYVVNHEFLQGTPYPCKPLESLIYGEAYCDFQARTLNMLLTAAGIRSRYAMLLDKNGISPHTLNEVYLNKKWRVFDPAFNIIFKDTDGQMATLEQLSEQPDIITNNIRVMAKNEIDVNRRAVDASWYRGLFPLPLEPRRSKPDIDKLNVFQRLTKLYCRLFGSAYYDFYQDAYLFFKQREIKQDDLRLFYLARNYHLAYRKKPALKYYQRLLAEYPQSKYTQDAVFFLGIFYFEVEKDFPRAIAFFNRINEKYPDKWGKAAGNYLGKLWYAK